MNDSRTLDQELAHKHFSTSCFNQAWELIDKPQRTDEENARMICLALTSLWHWTQRPDCSNENLSIGYWQVSRAYALAGQADNARKYGRLCLEKSSAEPPFFIGYAYEALARAESVAGCQEPLREFLQQAWKYAEQIEDAGDKALLVNDLKALG